MPLAFEVQYRPFILHNELCPVTPVRRDEYYSKKYGAERFAQIRSRAEAAAKANGLHMCVSLSFRAHRPSSDVPGAIANDRPFRMLQLCLNRSAARGVA